MTSKDSNHYRLRGRRILLGITAGIAAYKSAELARLLIKQGAEVCVVMTPSATEFVGTMTFQALTGNPVRTQIFDAEHESAMGHIELARWAELILVAPATADFLAKLQAGFADTLLHTLCLATEATIAVVPAMNQRMWANPATQSNMSSLKVRGTLVFGPANGVQACGDQGFGRMLEAEEVLEFVVKSFGEGRYAGVKVVVTAGPTREALDAVRFLGNRSSGKMGFAIAEALLREGAELTLISGPVSIEAPKGALLIGVESAAQMHTAALAEAEGADLFVACAAVADYRPQKVAEHKIKKEADELSLTLIKNRDILSDVSALDKRPFCVGFAAETQNIEAYAEAKRKTKKIEMIAANLVGESQGFDNDNNALLVFWEGGKVQFPNQPKTSLAEQLISLIADKVNAQTPIKNS